MIAYTAIYGGYDPLKPHPDHPLIDEWRCYTDDESLTDSPGGWRVIVEPRPYLHPRLDAKWWKCHPPQGRALWLDGSIEILEATFIDQAAEALDGNDMAMWVHPWRDCIFEEVGASVPMPKYHGLPLEMQAQHYARFGWQPHAGLWASTVIAWGGTDRARQMGAAWFAHCELATYQDQLSLPPLIARYGVRVGAFPSAFADRQLVKWHGHTSLR